VHHVAAVRAAVKHRPVGVEPLVGAQAVVERDDVAHGVEAQPHVVEVLVALAVAGRAAHVRQHDREARIDEVLDERDPHRPPLRLGTAVDLEDQRPRRLGGRREQPVRHRLTVEGLEALERRLGELRLVDATRRRREPAEPPGVALGDPDAPGRTRRRQAERKRAAVGRLRVGLHDGARRQLELPLDRQRAGIEQAHPGRAVDVRVDDEPPARAVDAAVQVPVVLEHVAPRAGVQVEARDAGDVATGARREEEARAVGRPRGLAEGRVRLLRGNDERLVLDEVDEVQVVVARPVGKAQDGEPAAVGREACRPAEAARSEDEAFGARVERAHVDVQVAAVGAVARVGEPGSVARDPRRDMQEVGLHHERHGRRAGARVEQVQLHALVAALVDLEQNPVAGGQEAARNGLAEIGQPDDLASVRGREVELHRPGVVRLEQDPAVGRDVQRQGPGDLEEIAERGHVADWGAGCGARGLM
jgi:hypothetical protein